MRVLKFITGHVIYNPAYTYKFQLKTTQVNQYEDYNGSRPFAEAPDDLVTEVALKWFD